MLARLTFEKRTFSHISYKHTHMYCQQFNFWNGAILVQTEMLEQGLTILFHLYLSLYEKWEEN